MIEVNLVGKLIKVKTGYSVDKTDDSEDKKIRKRKCHRARFLSLS